MKKLLVHLSELLPHDRKRGCSKQAWSVIAFLACATASGAFGQAAPSAREILDGVRLRESQQQLSLEGQIRQENIVVPFELQQTGPVVRYLFTNPEEALQLHLGDNDSRLEEITKQGTERATPAQLDKRVRGTAITYEDLALKFIYWNDARVIGSENIKTRDCWKLQVKAPPKQSQYSSVNLWIDKSGGALMRVEGFNASGQLAKKFEVVSAQKIDGRWFLKQMRIEELVPGTNTVRARTYLEIKNNPKPPAPR